MKINGITILSSLNTVTNYIPKFTGASALGDSLIYDNGTNVGIGTTSPSQKLTVGDGTGTGNQYVRINSSSADIYIGQQGETLFGIAANSSQLIVGDNTSYPLVIGTTNAQPFIFGTTNAERVRITSAGNIGIGTTSPSGKLDVAGTSGTFRIEGGGDAIAFTKNGANYISAKGGTSSLLVFETGGTTERMRITSGGNVGIGTTAPAYKLEVAGTFFAGDSLGSNPYMSVSNTDLMISGRNGVALYLEDGLASFGYAPGGDFIGIRVSHSDGVFMRNEIYSQFGLMPGSNELFAGGAIIQGDSVPSDPKTPVKWIKIYNNDEASYYFIPVYV